MKPIKWKYADPSRRIRLTCGGGKSLSLERSCLRLADSKTGAKVIPLAAPALDVLTSAPRVGGNPYVYWGAARAST